MKQLWPELVSYRFLRHRLLRCYRRITNFRSEAAELSFLKEGARESAVTLRAPLAASDHVASEIRAPVWPRDFDLRPSEFLSFSGDGLRVILSFVIASRMADRTSVPAPFWLKFTAGASLVR